MIAYFDMFSGISGDMTLGAFVDLGVPLEWLTQQLITMPLKEFDMQSRDVWRNGIRATDITVTETKNVPSRNYKEIKTLISNAPFSSRVITQSLEAFKKIALAESRIHGSDLETVHFHEVGGVDALVDIVGSFLCVEYLGITQVVGSRVPLGQGAVSCSHGTIPVPAPATLAILQGVPVTASDKQMETVTPTGAAVITTLTREFGALPEMRLGKTGYGAGKRKSSSGTPNLLRIILGTQAGEGAGHRIRRESVWVVETSLDDMNPELFGYIMEKLFDAGALDVCHLPLQMKKNRPGTRLEVLCREDRLDDVIQLILTQSSAIGVRFHKVRRAVLDREVIDVTTCFGAMKAKRVVDPSGAMRIVPEYEECRQVAEKTGSPLREVYEGVLRTLAPAPDTPTTGTGQDPSIDRHRDHDHGAHLPGGGHSHGNLHSHGTADHHSASDHDASPDHSHESGQSSHRSPTDPGGPRQQKDNSLREEKKQ